MIKQNGEIRYKYIGCNPFAKSGDLFFIMGRRGIKINEPVNYCDVSDEIISVEGTIFIYHLGIEVSMFYNCHFYKECA